MNYMSGMIGFTVLLVVFAANLNGWRLNKLQKKIAEQQTQIADLKRELEEMKRKEWLAGKLPQRGKMSITPGVSRGIATPHNTIAPKGRNYSGFVSPHWGYKSGVEPSPPVDIGGYRYYAPPGRMNDKPNQPFNPLTTYA